MSRPSLKARILLGAILWTIGLFPIAGVLLHAVVLDHSAAAHFARHSSAQTISYWIFFRHGPAAVLVGGLLMLLGYFQIQRGIAPINELRHRLAAVHKGVDAQVGGSYPSEVQPLVDDLNVLLDERERRVARAVAKAGDLAHGLKTPLAVLAHEAQQVRVAGHGQLAAEIDQQIDRMRGQIDYHLAHARSAASSSGAARASIAESGTGIIRVLQRLHIERGIQIDSDVSTSHVFLGTREDLDEMLGNLLDNACKWARTQVKLTSSKQGDAVTITVDDDGPGIEPSMRCTVIQRGVRADEVPHGSGLGLAIVSDLAELYGGSIRLDESPMGGARARLTLPAEDVADSGSTS